MANRTGSRGTLRGQVNGNCDDYGIDEGSISIIIRTFMTMNGENAIHWIDMGKGVLLFAQSRPDNPDSGVIYVYAKTSRAFWGLNFDEGWDPEGNQFFSRAQFEELVEEYSLGDYAAQPCLLEPLAEFAKA